MANKTIAVVDINNFHNQNIELLLFASIIRNKVKKLSILDLNYFGQDKLLSKDIVYKKQGEFHSTTIFGNTLYQISSNPANNQNKLLNLAKAQQTNNDILLINTNSQRFHFNSSFFDLVNEIIVFADIKQNLFKNIMNLFLEQNIKNKHIHLIVYNYEANVQHKKIYMELLKQFRTKNITISNIDSIPKLKTLEEIENVDPWLDIYKKINSTF